MDVGYKDSLCLVSYQLLVISFAWFLFLKFITVGTYVVFVCPNDEFLSVESIVVCSVKDEIPIEISCPYIFINKNHFAFFHSISASTSGRDSVRITDTGISPFL